MSFVAWHIVLLELAVEDLKGILMKAVAFKQCSFDIKGAKVCQENIPNLTLLHHLNHCSGCSWNH